LWIGDRRIRSERCITLHTVRSLGMETLDRNHNALMHEASIPADADPPENAGKQYAPNDEDGRDPPTIRR